MTDTLIWDEAGARYYETGVSKGIFFPIDGSTGVPWNGLVAVNLDPQGGDPEHYYYDGIKYMDRMLAEDFQATIQAITTPKEFERSEGVREVKYGMRTHFNQRDKFHMAWRTEIGNDQGEAVAYKIHIAYNNLVQPSSRAYQTKADTTNMDVRTFIITATPACGRNSYFTFDSRDGDLSALEAQLNVGVLPKCWDLPTLVGAPAGGGNSGDPDLGCPVLIEDFQSYNPGQTVNDEVTDGVYYKYIYGKINNGLDVSELPAEGAFAANDSAASEVGTHPVLVDDDDATYITSADGDLGYTVGLPPLVGYVPGSELEIHIRASITGGVSEDDPDNLDADAQVHISTDAGGDNTIGGFSDGTDEGMGFSLTDVEGTIVDYVIPLSMDAWVDSTIEDVVTALQAGAFLNVVGASNNNFDTTPVFRVYEASVVVLDGTDESKSLRTSDPTETDMVQLYIYDGPASDPGSEPLIAALTYEVDFMCKVRETSDDYSGFQQNPLTDDENLVVLSTFSDDGDGDDPAIQWFDGTISSSVPQAEMTPLYDVWYRVIVDKDWDTVHFRITNRDTGALIVDNSHANTEDPKAYIKNAVGYVSNSDGSKAYEVMVDNAKIQIHCNVEGPSGPIVIDLPAWACNDIGGAPFDDTSRFTTQDDSGDYSITTNGRIGVGYFAEEEHVGGGYPNLIYMPDTPDGYALTRATYVVRAYRESDGGIYSGSPFSNYTPGTGMTNPYLNAESSGTSTNYTITPLPVGSFGEVEWSGDEVLTRLTNPAGSQLPCTRLWNEAAQSPYDIVTHVSYYAVRLYYDPV